MSVRRSVRHAVRQLASSPGFATVALLTLAIGIGACVAIFSVFNSLLLTPLPYPDSGRLVVINEANPPQLPTFSVAPGQYFHWRQQSGSFESLAALRQATFVLTGTGEPVNVSAGLVSANMFSTLGVRPEIGRDFFSETAGRENVAILSHGLWLRRFGGRPDIVSQTIRLNDTTFSIVGVMPRSFQLGGPLDLYVPAAYSAADRNNHAAHVIDFAVGRLKPGVTIGQARSELGVIAARLAQQFPATNEGWGVNVRPILESVVGDVSDVLFALLGAVGFLLLIACANVANLLLARATMRSKEMAIRSALGATHGQIVRQLLTESLVLAVLGSVLGVAVGYLGMNAIVAFAPEGTPRIEEVGIDLRVLGVTCALAVFTSIAFGLAPALRAARVDFNQALKETGRGAGVGGRRYRLNGALVVAEVTMAFMLLVGAGTFIRSFQRLRSVDPGFRVEGAVVANLQMAAHKYSEPAQRAELARKLTEQVAALPGVSSVGASQVLPLVGSKTVFAFQIAGRPAANTPPTASYYAISPDYFRAMGIPLLRGRAFGTSDVATGNPVAIVSASIARRIFAGEEALGKRIAIGNDPSTWREIVGVVGDIKHDSLDDAAVLQVYEPLAQRPATTLALVVRTSDARGLDGALRSTIHALNGDQPAPSVRPFAEYVESSMSGDRFAMFLVVVFATIALVLAAIGIYGVMAYVVSQRTAEIGIRMALGSRASGVLRLIMIKGGRLVALGLVLGAAGALLLGQVLAAVLYGVKAADPLTFGAITAILCLAAGLACWLPARRASKVDPMIALRANAS